MRLAFQYCADDLREMKRLRPRITNPVRTGLLALLAFGLLGYFLARLRRDGANIPLWSGIVLVIWWVVFRFLRRLGRYDLVAHPPLRCPLFVEIFAGGLRIISEQTMMNFDWKEFDCWSETPSLIVLRRSDRQFLMIPKRSAQTQEQLMAFRSLIEANVPPSEKMLRLPHAAHSSAWSSR
jgi:hypothetical protein